MRSSELLRYVDVVCAMSATLTKQFEGFAKCCLELARSAETTERRARFIQMADEYRLATLLISEERKSRRLLPSAAGSHLLSLAAEAPAAASLRLPVTVETWLQSTNVWRR